MPPWSKHEQRIRQRNAKILSLWRNRVDTGITQAAIAQRFGIRSAHVSKIIKDADQEDVPNENP